MLHCSDADGVVLASYPHLSQRRACLVQDAYWGTSNAEFHVTVAVNVARDEYDPLTACMPLQSAVRRIHKTYVPLMMTVCQPQLYVRRTCVSLTAAAGSRS